MTLGTGLAAAWPIGFCLLACTLGRAAPCSAAPAPPDSATVAPALVAPAPADGAAAAAAPADSAAVDAGTVPVYELPPVTVTADAVERTIHENPGFAEEVSAFDLRHRLQPRTLPEALKGLPGVMVQRTSHGQGSPFIRGFTGFRTLFLIDGIRLNNSVFRDGPNQYWATVDPMSLARLTVVRGPSAVLLGSEAVGGVVQAVTRGWQSESASEPVEPGVRTRFSTAEEGRTGRAEAAGRLGERSGYVVGLSAKRHGDLRAGPAVGTQPRTGYDETGLEARVDAGLSSRWSLRLAYQQSDIDDAWRTHKTMYGVSWKGTTVGDEKRRSLDNARRLAYVQLRGSEPGWGLNRAFFSLSYHRQREERFRVRADDRSDRQRFEVGTLGLAGEVEGRVLGGAWTTGGDLYVDDVGSFSHRYAADGSFVGAEIQGPVADDARYDLAGFFLRASYAITARADLHLGGRATLARAEALRVRDPATGDPLRLEDSWSRLTGSARLAVHLDEAKRRTLFAGVAQAFRAPNLSDLTRFDSARTNELEVASPGLEPETFLTVDAGVKALSPGWSMQAAVFWTDIDGLIVRTPTGRVVDGLTEVTKRNSSRGYIAGMEAGASVALASDWTLSAAGAALYGETDVFPSVDAPARREVLDRLPPWAGRVGLLWRHPGGRGWAEIAVDAADRADKLSSRDRADTQRIPPGGTPGYAVVSVRGGWEVARRLTLDVALENLTDADYRIHGSGVNEAGRNLVVGLAAGF